MTTQRLRILLTALTTATTLLAGAGASADDTELFVGAAVAAPPTRPNIMFVLDTSGSMAEQEWTQEDYNAKSSYDGECSNSRIYWLKDSSVAAPPKGVDPKNPTGLCDTSQYIDDTKFVCKAARPKLDSTGIETVVGAAQWFVAKKSDQNRWRTLTAGDKDNYVECSADQGNHGNSDASLKKYAVNGKNGPYTSTANTPWPGGSEAVTFYKGNYLNWLANPKVQRQRLQIVRSAMATLLDNLADGSVNVGLMRYSNDRDRLPNASDGGMVVEEIGPIESKREAMKATISSWIASGSTPLTETLYEASLYFRGESVHWGLTSDQCYAFQGSCPLASNPDSDTPSVLASRNEKDPSKYDSPADEDCQRNYIVYLTDGLPQSDSNSDASIRALPNFATIIGAANCTTGKAIQSAGDGTGQCLDELAKWMNESDLRPDRPGTQNVTTYWIGFGTDVADGTETLQYVAGRGGGQYYSASDTHELTTAFSTIIAQINDQSQTFMAPAVAVNAFNRTQNLNYLYMSLFKPSTSYRWLGNVKKYRVTTAGTIVDQEGNAAVNPTTGFFTPNSRSYWSDVIDGDDAASGGAAGEIKDPSTRKVYSNLTITSGPLSDEPLSLLEDPAQLTLANSLLLNVESAVAVADRPAVSTLVDWAYGYDVNDDNGNGATDDARLDMGDPLHSRPATVIYGGDADNPDLVLYGTTNDGYLQAIDADDGSELWSFVPRELLVRIEKLYENEEVAARTYGLDGDVEVLRIDNDNDGEIESADDDRVILFFGMRRGGSGYYAIDVTSKSNPKLLWSLGPADLPGIGQTWSTPTVTRINVDRTWPAANTGKHVLVFGGGFDTAEESIGYVSAIVGNGVYIVDAFSGAVIWRAGPDASAQLQLAKMTNSIPGEVRPVDLTGDGFADRIYSADLGGRVWRFDIYNGNKPASLVTGGVFASVGLGDLLDKSDATKNRRFFYAPDISLMRLGDALVLNVAIGSGHRERPITDQTVVNRFYSLRDYNVFTRIASNQYKSACGVAETSPCHQIITDDDARLVDVQPDNLAPDFPPGSIGWKLSFGDDGEKVLAESRTFRNVIYFPTYSPQEREYNPEACVATVGLNRLYVVDAATSKPVMDLVAATPGNERSRELMQGSIAPAVTFIFPTPDKDPDDPTKPMPAVPPFCLIGLESCGTGLANPPVRTYWDRRGSN